MLLYMEKDKDIDGFSSLYLVKAWDGLRRNKKILEI